MRDNIVGIAFFHWMIDNQLGHLYRDVYYYHGTPNSRPEFIVDTNKTILLSDLLEAYSKDKKEYMKKHKI
jgi:hypothetical protein